MQHLLSGVSATALTVAAARAIATADPDTVFDDPYAHLFVAASGHDELPCRLEDAPDSALAFWERISAYLAARSTAFDRELLEAADRGIRQVVLVAAGLDARAYRLSWPAGTRLFEIDRAPVLEVKQRVLDAAGARPTADRRAIASDVAHDWPAALSDAGFDPSQPTAWLVEGLLPYLPSDLETDLIERIVTASTPGSRLVLEFIRRPDDTASLGAGATQIAALFDPGPRPDTLGLLEQRGWTVETRPAGDLSAWATADR